MGAVMVKCPETGRQIPTGMVADRQSFEATPVFFARVHCPICRGCCAPAIAWWSMTAG